MFQKGHEKKGGRKKGTPNKATTKIKEVFAQIVEDNLETLKNDIAALDPKDRVWVILTLAEYIVPKMARMEPESEGEEDQGMTWHEERTYIKPNNDTNTETDTMP